MEDELTVTVLNIQPVKGRGNLKAFASIKIGPLEIHKCRIVQQSGQSAYVSCPQEEWKDGAGRTQYCPILKWPDEWRLAVNAAVLPVWQQEAHE